MTDIPLVGGKRNCARRRSQSCRGANDSFSPQRLSDIDKSVSSDAFEGRGPATAGETKTIDYIVDQFKAAGLQPGGDRNGERSWTQDVPLRVGHRGPAQVSVNANGASRNSRKARHRGRAPMNGQNRIDIRTRRSSSSATASSRPSGSGTTSRARTCAARSCRAGQRSRLRNRPSATSAARR